MMTEQDVPDRVDPDWTDMATRLDDLADDLMAAAPAFGGELDEAAMELWSITLQHYAIQLRQKGDE